MPARVHIVCGLRAALLDRFRAAPGALWLGPTRRAVTEARRSLGPDAAMWSIADFADDVVRRGDPDARPLSAAQRRLVADDLVQELFQQGEVKHFGAVSDTRGFTEGLTNLFAELQRLDVSPAEFTHAAGQPKERECARVYARYMQELSRLHLLDPDGRTARAAALLRDESYRPFDVVRTVFVEGFTDFSAVQFELLDALAGRVEEMWFGLPDEPDDDRAELFSVPRGTLQRLTEKYPDATVDTVPRSGGQVPEVSGLTHIARQLFRSMRSVEVAENADGMSLIEAPGVLGEARMVARRIKTLLLDGVPPEEILIVLRDIEPNAELLREVFAEYGLPVDIEGTEPLLRHGSVAALLRAVRLPEDDWPFAGVTALLRNTFFRPMWPEIAGDPEMANKAEALLRLLGEPRGRDAYLAAAQRWAEEIQPGLEDEQAQESRRRRTHELASHCAAFLPRFFRAWDDAPTLAPLAEHVAWLRRFADDLGFPEDAALTRLWREIDCWLARPGRPLDRKTFHRRLTSLASGAGLAKTPRGSGRIRVLSAEMARNLDADVVFLMGLGERSFPRLLLPPTLLDESERQAFKQAGIAFAGANELLPSEMLLFYQLVTKPRRGLVLSYPAVDARGQALLPSSFLLAVVDCFNDGAIATTGRRMLTEGYDRDEPLSHAELRVLLARRADDGHGQMPANLRDAADLSRRRFHEGTYNAYDGSFSDPDVIDEVARIFVPERVFSPTALEDYVACPFRFFLKHVLRLEPLEDPKEEIEVTRRGQAFHRALARLHRSLKEQGIHRPSDAVRSQMLHEIEDAVREDVSRAPSPASKALWRLEGQRLLRVASRYGAQWEKFLEPWQGKKVQPTPHWFEVDFGLAGADGSMPHGPLIIRSDGIEVRVSGRIDRVDIATLPDGPAFWIIDYKTGLAGNYTGADLANFRRLQLTLYALAVEEVLLADKGARPLGLAYWMVTETGPKIALPAKNQLVWLDEPRQWRTVREKLQAWVATLASNIRRGNFSLTPRSDNCTELCPFSQVCRITQSRHVGKEGMLALPSC
jgi:ATP-dependent helicase/DNAse subunit B